MFKGIAPTELLFISLSLYYKDIAPNGANSKKNVNN